MNLFDCLLCQNKAGTILPTESSMEPKDEIVGLTAYPKTS